MTFVHKNFVSENNWVEFSIYIEENNDFWFKTREIAEFFKIKNIKNAVKKHISQQNKISWLNLNKNPDRTNFLNPNTILVNEDGLYEFINNTNFFEGLEFKKWIESTLQILKESNKEKCSTETLLKKIIKQLDEILSFLNKTHKF